MSENPTNVGFLGVDYLLRFEMLSIFKYNINIESSLVQQISHYFIANLSSQKFEQLSEILL
ncbi:MULTISPECIES: hypothetical protein [Acinetobacter]|uniref:hypothetical protein n=1 Tax=Acinetobacter TaxID=469 RepID=UPI0012DB5D5B|nr:MULTISPECIES: hypothetical protein [unclassified Acinetobacter]WEE40532.1 hypothetical protein PYV58_05080 [Acinetobacter sp. TAC-1]